MVHIECVENDLKYAAVIPQEIMVFIKCNI